MKSYIIVVRLESCRREKRGTATECDERNSTMKAVRNAQQVDRTT
jgi:hypothetical protein